MHDKDEHLISQIARKIKKGEIILFLGAGVSKIVDPRYPTGQELKSGLLKELPTDIDPLTSLHEVAEVYEKIFSRAELINFISDKVIHPEYNSNLHKILLLFPSDLITTNYDTIIEANHRDLFPGECLNIIVDDSDMTFHKNGKTILKIHGSFSWDGRSTSIIITNNDYAAFKRDNKFIKEYLKVMFCRSIVFLGYSMDDENIMEVHDEIINYQKEKASQCYYVASSPTVKQVDMHHIVSSDLHVFARRLFEKVFFDLDVSKKQEPNENSNGISNKLEASENINHLIEYLKQDQFASGLWGKSICQLFMKCFHKDHVPSEYNNFGSFSATDIVLRDLNTTIGLEPMWNTDGIMTSIKTKSDISGGVGLIKKEENTKFSQGQLIIDKNIRHTCAVINIFLLLGKYTEALTSLKWVCQMEKDWFNNNDGKLPINLACIIDCIEYARKNIQFSDYCYQSPDDFKAIIDVFMLWDDKKNVLYKELNNALLRVENLWALKNNSSDILEDTKIYITLFILLRLSNYPPMFPKLFTKIAMTLYNAFIGKPGLSLTLNNKDITDIGATGSFLHIVFNPKAQKVLKHELEDSVYCSFSDWCKASYKYLINNIKNKEILNESFSEIVSPIIPMIKQNKING